MPVAVQVLKIILLQLFVLPIRRLYQLCRLCAQMMHHIHLRKVLRQVVRIPGQELPEVSLIRLPEHRQLHTIILILLMQAKRLIREN